MEMTPIDRGDKRVPTGDGATPQGRDLSSSEYKEELTKPLDPSEIVKHEIPVDRTADTIADLLRRADPRLDAETARNIARKLLGREEYPTASEEKDKAANIEQRVGTTVDVSA
jgi:hypothetical protein